MKIDFTASNLAPLDLSPEDIERLQRMKELQDQILDEHQAAIEAALIARLEELLGRVPSQKEMKEKGGAEMDKDGNMVFSWKGKPILKAAPLAPVIVPRE